MGILEFSEAPETLKKDFLQSMQFVVVVRVIIIALILSLLMFRYCVDVIFIAAI